jgi:hypothetical protein
MNDAFEYDAIAGLKFAFGTEILGDILSTITY